MATLHKGDNDIIIIIIIITTKIINRDCRSVLNYVMVTYLTKCHIHTVMIQMKSHGHGMHLLVLTKFYHFALKCYIILKTVRCF